ncbi:MAG: cobalt ECF transporter T component CbiQ [Chloroflexi bacterium]|nr:cobalt ECF transporter T component CbiQ [Chloroflexota bacterium]
MTTRALPDWYYKEQAYPEGGEKGRGTGFIKRALAAFGESLVTLLSGEEGVPDSFLSAISPAAKIIGIIALIVGVTLIQRPLILIFGFLITLVVMGAARIPVRRVVHIWLGVPVFSLAVILPAVLNLFSPGDVIIALWSPGPGAHLGHWNLPPAVGVTMEGLEVASRFMLRVIICVNLALLLTATTPPVKLLSAFRRMGMPNAFGMVLVMMYRYLVLLVEAVREIHEARLSRPYGGMNLRAEQNWIAAGVGNLFRRTWYMGEEVRQAMAARGFGGDLKTARPAVFQAKDWTFLACCILMIFIGIWSGGK